MMMGRRNGHLPMAECLRSINILCRQRNGRSCPPFVRISPIASAPKKSFLNRERSRAYTARAATHELNQPLQIISGYYEIPASKWIATTARSHHPQDRGAGHADERVSKRMNKVIRYETKEYFNACPFSISTSPPNEAIFRGNFRNMIDDHTPIVFQTTGDYFDFRTSLANR